MSGRAVDDPRIVGLGSVDPGSTVKERTLGYGSGRSEVPLPPDASSTLFVEGLPPNCTRREVARILMLAYINRHCLPPFLHLHFTVACTFPFLVLFLHLGSQISFALLWATKK